jgi:hypothetical protein
MIMASENGTGVLGTLSITARSVQKLVAGWYIHRMAHLD